LLLKQKQTRQTDGVKEQTVRRLKAGIEAGAGHEAGGVSMHRREADFRPFTSVSTRPSENSA